MSVLIGCEESGVVTAAMRALGIEAWSCDLQPTRGDPRWHIQGDVVGAVASRRWSLIVLHPDCTAMAVSGNRWYGRGMPYHRQRIDAVAWTLQLWDLATHQSPRVALENPCSVIFPPLEARGARVQYVQPWEYGHGETKRTGFALTGLPELVPTDVVDGREQRVWRMPPGPNRKRDRSKTYAGIAAAIADQWGRLVASAERAA